MTAGPEPLPSSRRTGRHACPAPDRDALITALHQAKIFDQGDGTWDTPTINEAELIVDVLLAAWNTELSDDEG